MSWVEDNSELLEGFVVESRDALDSINPFFIEIIETINDEGTVDPETMNCVFRLFHTMKGSAGFLNLNTLVEVNHEAETLLDLCRGSSISLKASWFEILLSACDILSSILDGIETSGSDKGIVDTESILQTLKDTIHCIKNGSSPEEMESEPQNLNRQELTGDEFTLDFSMLSPEIIDKFVQEGLELLDEAEASLLSLSKNAEDRSGIDTIFRNLHTFKGNCGFMSLASMQKVTHSLESITDGLRGGFIRVSEPLINTILSSIDSLKESLFDLLKGGKGDLENADSLISILKDLEPDPDAKVLKPAKKATKQSSNNNILIIEDDKSSRTLLTKILKKSNYLTFECETAEEALEILTVENIDLCISDIFLPGMSGKDFIAEVNTKYSSIPIIALSGNKDRALLKDLMKLEVYGFLDKPINKDDLLKLMENALTQAMRKRVQSGISEDANKTANQPKNRQDIRVDLNKLDLLVDLVGELIIAEAMVTKHPTLEGLELPGFERAAHRLHIITNELQDITMAVRMVPIAGVFKKMMRLVHDVSLKTNKPLKLSISGETTEVDKVVIDMIADPLVHMIRNSADHGIEDPEGRLKAGKSETGHISLDAIQKASEVLIIIKDDGRGLNRDQLYAKCLKNGLISEGDVMTDSEVYQMIFEPGFSTAEAVTDLSGRGVGMDVVKKNIEHIKGRIEIISVAGEGCTFIIHIPLTLATIEGMLVTVGSTKYTIPITSIRESLRADHSMITIRPDGQEFVRIRNSLSPIFRLHKLHDLVPVSQDLTKGILIVLDLFDGSICLFVDEILHQVQTVIKNLSGYMGNVKGISGCNILGNGEVALILDPDSILKCLPAETQLLEKAN
jgi:two-component system, chemotaxis family, sensor kinase CheA